MKSKWSIAMTKNVNSLIYRSGRLRYLLEKEIKKKNADSFFLLRLKRLLLIVEQKLKTSLRSPTQHGYVLRALPLATNLRR